MNDMYVSPEELRTIARMQPRLALMLLSSRPKMPRTYTITFTWDAATPDQVVPGSISEKIYNPFWVQDAKYTLRKPNYLDGNPARYDAEYKAALIPYIDIKLDVVGSDRWALTTQDFEPIENIMSFGAQHSWLFNKYVVLGEDQQIQGNAVNRRTWENTEVPVTLRVTFSGIELDGCKYCQYGYDKAVCELQKLGVLPPDSV